jgi:hypothetical protein
MVPLKSANTRVFLIEGRARPDRTASYKSTMRLMGISQGFGDIERIELPSEDQYGNFEEVGQIRGAIERATTSLEGRYALDLKSDLLKLGQQRCAFDIQLHMGACQDPRTFSAFDKIVVLENASITSYSTEDLGALASSDNALVNETAEISAEKLYEILKISFGQKAASIVTNEVVDVVFCDAISCGDCTGYTDGCYKIFAVTTSAGGSPSTPADVVFSIDKGVNWYAHDVDTLGAANAPSAIACVGNYVVVASNAANSLYYALKTQFDGMTDPAFTAVATGLVANKEPNDIWSIGNYAFVVGDGGYVYEIEDVTAGVAVLDAGSAVTSNLNAVHAISQTMAVAVGDGGTVIYTTNGSTWATTTTNPVGAGVNLTSVWVMNENEWFVGSDAGRLYYTLNQGATWTEKSFSGSGAGVVYDISFVNDTVGYISHSTAAPRARVLRTYDGGNSWVIMPEDGSMPLADRFTAIATCPYDVNLVVAGGLADDAADGMIVLGAG